MWANKGLLRDLSKNLPASQVTQQPHTIQQEEVQTVLQQQKPIARVQQVLDHSSPPVNESPQETQGADVGYEKEQWAWWPIPIESCDFYWIAFFFALKDILNTNSFLYSFTHSAIKV
jgi:hypothetical protein